MADLHSAAGNESRCNCFGRPGTNPGCPVHGNHAIPPVVRHQERPTDQGVGENTSGPGWDALRADRDRLADRLNETYRQRDIARGELNAARRELDEARRAAIGLSAGLESARRDGAADMLDRAAAKLQAYSDVHSSTVAMLRRWADEVRTIPPTDRSSE